MIARILPGAYDFEGQPTLIPKRRAHRCFHPTYPMGRFLSAPLSTHCKSLEEIRLFLASCRYLTDEVQFGKKDFWQPPEEFERRKQGDCEDFALWAWRQLLALGYEARFVVGCAGRYGSGHAWVAFSHGERQYLLEPQFSPLGLHFPRLTTLVYQPEVSVGWDNKRVLYFRHHKNSYQPIFSETLPLIPEWLGFWLGFWLRFAYRLVRYLPRRLTRRLRPATWEPHN